MNRDELSVYADELQVNGDLRGEIIALELQPRRPDIDARHAALMRQWLRFDHQGMPGVRFKHAFVDVTTDGFHRVVGTAAEAYVRSAFISGTNTDITRVLDALLDKPRPHLARLVIGTRLRYGGEPRAANAPFVITDAVARRLCEMTPNLELLSLGGNRLVREVPHPTLRRLRVVGHNAMASLVETGAAMPAVRELAFSFSADQRGRIMFGSDGLPRTLLARSVLPALEALDLGGNEQQRTWEDRHVPIFELLSELGVLHGLRRLRVPTILVDDERAALDHAVAQIRALDLLETGNELPAPLHDLLDESPMISVRFESGAYPLQFSMRRLGELMAARWSAFDDDTREAWTDFWNMLAGLPLEAEDYWMYDEAPTETVSIAPWRAPLASLEESVDDDYDISVLADALARTTAKTVAIRRRRY